MGTSIERRHDVRVVVDVRSQALVGNPPLPSKACLLILTFAAEAFTVSLAAILILVGKLALGAGRELYSTTRLGGG